MNDNWRKTIFLAVTLALLLSLGCSGKRSPGDVSSAKDAGIARVNAAEEATRSARELVDAGQLEAARLEYERAAEILLNLPAAEDREQGAADDRARVLLAEVIAEIHDIEQAQRVAILESAADSLEELDASKGNDDSETAAADELASDPILAELEVASEGISATDLAPEVQFTFPIEYNARVESLVKMYKERKRDWFQQTLDRSGRYLPMVRRTFREHGLPEELAALAMVESAFKPRAVSRAGARGIWQFIRGTGRLYGLNQDFWVDDRFDPEKATDAAARHLKDLYEHFDDWYLAMAAYNSGPRRVERAIRRTGSRDFWVLAKKRRLPRETRSYVPLILAAMVIAQDPVAHGFTPPIEQELSYELVALDFAVDLETAAKAAGVSLEEMKTLNPELRRWVTPMDSPYDLKIPTGTKQAFRTALDEIPPAKRVQFGTHVVQRGDTLSRIANRYGSRINDIAAVNNLSRRSLIHPGQVLTIPVPGGARAVAAGNRTARRNASGGVYTVRRGDTLGRIASSFGLSLARLRELNQMSARETTIHPGQRLTVGSTEVRVASEAATGNPRAKSTEPSQARARVASAGTGHYLVQPGDTLGEIAERHGMGLSELRRKNGMRGRRSRIYPGQKLVVAVSSGASSRERSQTVERRYRVRRGDTLSKIAQRFGVSIDELREWNGIRRDRIVAGQSLTIYTGGDQ